MAEARRPRVYTIAAHRSFADALAAGLIRRFSGGELGLARGLVLLPNNRAKRALGDAFVRASGGGLLLPRLVALGDPALDEATAAFLDPADVEDPLPPAIAPLERRMILARLVIEARAAAGRPLDAAEAVRLAGDLARTLDQLLAEDLPPARLGALDLPEALSKHWERALDLFAVVLDRWPDELARRGCLDAADRRARLLARLARRWRDAPPAGFVCAAGVTDTAPSVARLLRVVAEAPRGLVVLADLSLAMTDDAWDALGPFAPDPATGLARRAEETHPQFHLKLLLDRMGVARGEVQPWRGASARDASLARGRAIANAFASAEVTAAWAGLPAEQRRLSGIAVAELPTPGAEAQAIALALREALETPGRTAALVTPDRALARRVAAHLGRWGVAVDDSAGRPLAILPPGVLLLLLAEAAAQGWAPLPLLALLKHPLVRAGEARSEWLDGARALDRALRGPRPAAGLAGVDAHLADPDAREHARRAAAARWWPEARDLLLPLERAFERGEQAPAALLAMLRETAQALCGDALWSGPAGRAAAELLAEAERHAEAGPRAIDPAALAPLLKTLTDEVAVRPPQGGHPRLAIYGLIEARLQSADLMILGGLNEGVWPGIAAPDPWLAPRIRAELGLPGLDRAIGVAAHDLAQGLGAPAALVTRSRRSGTQPAIASRFWLRLQALAGDRLERATALERWAEALDDPLEHAPVDTPAPVPPRERRPRAIAVTDVDRLKADPYAFYAKKILQLAALDAVDADPSAAWRGTAVHAVLERWARDDACDPARLLARAQAVFADARLHPLLRALWQPRLLEAVGWIAAETARNLAGGRRLLAVERSGGIEIGGVTLTGKFDRIDRAPDGSLVVIDYKTGKAPSPAAVREGFSLQLGLLGLMAERGGFDGIAGDARGFEYWSLAKKDDAFGHVSSPVDAAGRYGKVAPDALTTLAARHFIAAANDWLTGDAPFTAKLHPEYAPYGEYDQLMRRDEWYGRR